MTITFAYSADAQRMLDEADERWIAEHGYVEDNLSSYRSRPLAIFFSITQSWGSKFNKTAGCVV